MPHLVMFDVDGTLVDSAGFDGELYAQAVERVLGIEVDRDWDARRLVERLRALPGVRVAVATGG